jgi:hypothetical protein
MASLKNPGKINNFTLEGILPAVALAAAGLMLNENPIVPEAKKLEVNDTTAT